MIVFLADWRQEIELRHTVEDQNALELLAQMKQRSAQGTNHRQSPRPEVFDELQEPSLGRLD